ncbi:MAG: hypothetical protein J6W37_05855 [Bacteroidales bacterium]|nr:hypothetical protein [Bacteroidales bacterium]
MKKLIKQLCEQKLSLEKTAQKIRREISEIEKQIYAEQCKDLAGKYVLSYDQYVLNDNRIHVRVEIFFCPKSFNGKKQTLPSSKIGEIYRLSDNMVEDYEHTATYVDIDFKSKLYVVLDKPDFEAIRSIMKNLVNTRTKLNKEIELSRTKIEEQYKSECKKGINTIIKKLSNQIKIKK